MTSEEVLNVFCKAYPGIHQFIVTRKKQEHYGDQHRDFNKIDSMPTEIKFEITDHLTTLSTSPKGWTKELNQVSWNGQQRSMISGTGVRIIVKWEKA